MLKKDLTIPGAIVEVHNNPKDGITVFGKMESLPAVRLNGANGAVAMPGTKLTIVKKARRTEWNNTVRVKMPDGTEGEVYWCELKNSCNHI